jgi:hypothetical protein
MKDILHHLGSYTIIFAMFMVDVTLISTPNFVGIKLDTNELFAFD